jgi:hypothetical protein
VDWPAASGGLLLTQALAQLRAREGVAACGKRNSSYDAYFLSYYVTYCVKNISGMKNYIFQLKIATEIRSYLLLQYVQ